MADPDNSACDEGVMDETVHRISNPLSHSNICNLFVSFSFTRDTEKCAQVLPSSKTETPSIIISKCLV